MVVIKLWVRNSTCKSTSELVTSVYCMKCMTIDHCFKSHLFKLTDSSFYHTLKPQMIADINGLFPGNIFSSCNKADTVSFCIGTCHIINLFLGKGIHNLRCFQLIL